jgi:hypothetical protein
MPVTDRKLALRRLLAQNVMVSTHRLVRGVGDGMPPAQVRSLMRDRRLLLAELARYMNVPGDDDSLAALQAAVSESDRTLEALLG